MPLVGRKEEERFQGERRKHPRDFEGLVKELWSENPQHRIFAAVDLEAYPQAVKPLEERLKVEQDNGVKNAIINTLLKIGTDEALNALLDLLKSDDAYLRNQAIEVLAGMSSRVEEHLKRLLQSEDPDLRIFAINVMSSFKNPEVIEWLKQLIQVEENPRVMGVALDLLSEIATEDLLPILKKVRERFADYEYINFVLDLIEERLNA